MKLNQHSAAGLRYSPMCGTVYADGGFDYTLFSDSEDHETREASLACIKNGMPEWGHVSAAGIVTNR